MQVLMTPRPEFAPEIFVWFREQLPGKLCRRCGHRRQRSPVEMKPTAHAQRPYF
jgi:hypothetical protein